MGPVRLVVSLWGLHARPARDWEGARGHGAVILRSDEVLLKAEVYPLPHPEQVDP